MYSSIYDHSDIRNSTYSIMDYIKQYYTTDYICLDIGCGSCRKIVPVLDKVKQYYAIDNDPLRVREAGKLCAKFNNLILNVCDNYFLPYNKESFDLVSSFMTKYNTPEVWRVLKTGGLFIVEIPSAEDRRSLRKKFGQDRLGWRGRMLYDSRSEHFQRIQAELSPFFSIQRAEFIHFNTSLKKEKLIELLEMTGEIRDFGTEQDIMILETLQTAEGLISFEEDRILIVAKKRTEMEYR